MNNIRNHNGISPKIGAKTYIDPAATVIGDVRMGENVSIWPGAVVRGDVHYIKIGDNTNIQDGSILHVTHDGLYTPGGSPLIIGNGVTIGHQVVLHACTIDDYCLIGIGSIILDNVTIEKLVMIGAGSLVPPHKVLKSGYLYLGNPAKAVRKLTDEEKEKLIYSAKHYVKLKDKYLG